MRRCPSDALQSRDPRKRLPGLTALPVPMAEVLCLGLPATEAHAHRLEGRDGHAIEPRPGARPPSLLEKMEMSNRRRGILITRASQTGAEAGGRGERRGARTLTRASGRRPRQTQSACCRPEPRPHRRPPGSRTAFGGPAGLRTAASTQAGRPFRLGTQA